MVKAKELAQLGEKEREKKIEDLKLELIKARVTANKGGKTKIRTIKKTIARLLTLKKKDFKKDNTQSRKQ